MTARYDSDVFHQATHVTPPLAENDFNSAEYGIEINYFDSEKLKKVVSGGGGLPDGTMQQYVRPFCDANVILDCTWKPHFFYVSRITNEIAGYTPEVFFARAATSEVCHAPLAD